MISKKWRPVLGVVSFLVLSQTGGPALAHGEHGYGDGYAYRQDPHHGAYMDRGRHGSYGYQHGQMGTYMGRRGPSDSDRPMMMRPGGKEMMDGGPRKGMARGERMMQRDPDRELTADDVRQILEGRLAWRGNRRIEVGDVAKAEDGNITADIVTREGGVLVDRFRVDPKTGRMQRLP